MRVPNLAILGLSSTVLAQVGPQATEIPACVKGCDPAAIASVNCTNADQKCHCVRQDGILANITACADEACVNPSESIYTFTTLFGEVCAQFNLTVPIIGSNSSANGTNVTFTAPAPSVSPYTGAASRLVGSGSLTGATTIILLAAGAIFAL